ncbi:hypothetical protein RND71_008507 [Anisodus tanguticus]|uniref:Uncharacterized protein n=1 Tax=Anisodus tanguticus TaxID=243964 RepID=A0AAE1SKY2_9SOLA|nr:hypothetical protein RND71_008507 [Anisodus tanguticus]
MTAPLSSDFDKVWPIFDSAQSCDFRKVRLASKGNATTMSSSKPSDPSTTSCTPNTVEKGKEIEESQEQTNSADPSILPRTSRHTSKAWDNFTRK